jgi:hypothetical protein
MHRIKAILKPSTGISQHLSFLRPFSCQAALIKNFSARHKSKTVQWTRFSTQSDLNRGDVNETSNELVIEDEKGLEKLTQQAGLNEDDDDDDDDEDEEGVERVEVKFGYGTGRRKTAVAKVYINEGSGLFQVNDRLVSDYFLPHQRYLCLEPFYYTETAGLFDVKAYVKGGGISGNAKSRV